MLVDSFFYIDSDSFSSDYNFFCGFGVSKGAIVIGNQGYKQFLQEKGASGEDFQSGRFVGCFSRNGKTIVKTDDMGQELLFLYRVSEFDWAVSNSYWLLLHKLKKKNKSLNILYVAHRAFDLKGGKHIGEQILSDRTSVENVILVPGSQFLEIDHKDKSLRILGLSLYDHLGSFGGSSDDLIVDHLEEQVGIFRSLSEGGYDIQCDLSGGYDSRISFGLVNRSASSIRVRSLENREHEFTIAKKIAEDFELDVNGPFRRGSDAPGCNPLSIASSVDFWELSSGGGYLPIYPVSRASLAYGQQVSVGGDVCYGFSFFAGTAKFNGAVSKIYKDIQQSYADRSLGDQVANEFLRGVESTGAPIDSDSALQLYYSSYRARFHGGRNSYKVPHGRLRITPLQSSRLLSASLKSMVSGNDASHIIRSLYAAVNPDLARYPFVGDKKNVRYEDVVSSSLYRVNLLPKKYSLYDGAGLSNSSEAIDSPISSYQSDGICSDRTPVSFVEELNKRMSILEERYSGVVPSELVSDSKVILDVDTNLATSARDWARRYFGFKVFSILNG